MKKHLFFLCCFFLPLYLPSQTTFNHQYNFDFPFKLLTSVLPTDSCYYATGVITDTTDSVYKIGNIFIKFNLNGEVDFMKTLTSTEKWYETWWGDLLSTEDGGFLDVGLARDSTTKGLIIKYNNLGDTIFTTEFLNPYYPDESFLFTSELKIDATGDIWVLSGIDVDPLESHNGDIYVLKFDSQGNPILNYLFGQSFTEIPMTAIIDSDNGLIIGANKTNNGQVSQNFFSQTYILKIEDNGTILWEYHSPEDQLYNIARGLVKTPDGGLIVATGKGIEYQINQEDSRLEWFPYMFKLDTNHEFEWGREFRGTRHSPPFSFIKVVPAQDDSGYVAIGEIGEDVSIGEEVQGAWLVKASPEGDSLWARYYSVFDSIIVSPQPYDLKNTPDGGYIVVGQTHPKLPGGTVQRAWMLKVDEYGCLIPGCHIINDVDDSLNENPELVIYPNPTTDFLNFRLRGSSISGKATFRIIDVQGRLIKEYQTSHPSDTFIVPIEDWSEGVYFLQYIEGGRVVVTERFVKG